jgi:hypothetical protein
MSHGVGFTTGAGGGGGGGGGVTDDGEGATGVEDGAAEDGGAAEGDEGSADDDDECGGAAGVSACTAPCAHPATDINATAASSIRIAHPLSDSSFAEVDDRTITRVAKRRARLR